MDAGNWHLNSPPATVQVNRLFRWFDRMCAVNDVSFEIGPGQAVGFIGPNGAGKTTTMRMMSTLDEPDLGDALIGGFSVIDDPDRVRGSLGFMPDSYGSYPNVNCIEYIDFFARSYGLLGRQRLQAVRRVMDFTGLKSMAEKPVTGLSKGMKQRLCLGRAMVHDPQVLILDEPAAGLDPRARIELKEMIGRLVADGKSLLISSHILTELAEMCQRVIIIEHGKLLATGTIDEILSTLGDEADREQATWVTITLAVCERAEQAVQWLQQQTDVRQPKMQNNLIEFEFNREPQLQAKLLARMVHDGLAVTRFGVKQRSLEQAFLQVTTGVPR
jgi:ABC-2 type transport system ATP-binding protein